MLDDPRGPVRHDARDADASHGTKELTDAYDAYFSGPLGPLVKANDGDFFVDSHASDPWGAPEELWSSDMRTEFQARAGYDIVPDLAALFDPTMLGSGLGGPGTAGRTSASATAPPTASARTSTASAATSTPRTG